jgi:hypothetical protein
MNLDEILNAAKFIESYKDQFKDLDAAKLEAIVKDFAETHKEELKKLGDSGLEVIFKIIKGKLGEAELDYMKAVKGKGPAQLLREARDDIHKAREDSNDFMNFVRGVGNVMGAVFGAALNKIGVPFF